MGDPKTKHLFQIAGSLLSWFAIIGQLYLSIQNRITVLPEAIIRFFSYFTIQINILVAISFTVLWLKPASRWGRFFSNVKVQTALTVYIFTLGLIYQLVLRNTWLPQGFQRLIDELLHTILPLFCLLYWWFCVKRENIQVKDILVWQLIPFVYLLYTLARGALTDFYPYPFVDVATYGYQKILVNIAILFIVFPAISLLFLALNRLKKPD